MRPIRRRALRASLLLLIAAALPWVGVGENKLTPLLGGEARYLTHLSTDKPIYRPGETVYLRGVLLHAGTHKPLTGTGLNALVQVLGPRGTTVASGWVQGTDSVVGFRWPIPQGITGGEYRCKVTYPNHGFTPAQRTFDIRLFRAPRLKTRIEFARKGYGPGDTVAATLEVKRAEGGLPVGAKVDVMARVDGRVVHQGASMVDAAGNARVSFALPARIPTGDGTLAMTVHDGGIVETATKTIPILLRTVDLAVYPEGGDLVAGLPTRVYLSARTPAKKPADIAGEIVDADGAQVATFATVHEGRGWFALTPVEGATYTLRISKPSGIDTTFKLPAVKAQGAVVGAVADVTDAGARVALRVAATTAGAYDVVLRQREVERARETVTLTAGTPLEVALDPGAGIDGVLIATLETSKGTPVAERLVFRRSGRRLNIAVSGTLKTTPGAQAKLTVTTTDAAGKPVAAVVGLTVTDDSVLKLVERRERAPRLVAMAFLEAEVKDLADAHVYLDAKNPKAPRALDLLLGTQGWRRLMLVDPEAFLKANGLAGRRALAMRTSARPHWGRPGRGGELRRNLARDPVPPDAQAPPKPAAAPRPVKVAAVRKPQPARPQADRPVAAPARRPGPAADPAAGAPAAGIAAPAASKKMKMDRAAEEAEDLEEEKNAIGPRGRRALIRQDFKVVRVYAHVVRPDRRPGDRVDFSDTLYWTSGIKTDPRTGTATVAFGTSDAVTGFRVHADGFDAAGALGQGTALIESVQPFYLAPKLPLEVTAGDVIELPVGVVNGTDGPLTVGLSVSATSPQLRIRQVPRVQLTAGQRGRAVLRVQVGARPGDVRLTFAARAGRHADTVTKILRIQPKGFPVEVGHGGMLAAGGSAAHTLEIPADRVAGSLKAKVSVHPTPLASLGAALERLVREPHGCFEQTSSTTYPLVMAQQYFTSHHGVDPKVIERSRQLLAKGYKRLIGYECKQGGFEWFGADPGHEALTAYGLLEFSDMRKVFPVDAKMVDRTQKWLLAQRDGKGGFKRGRRALHTWVTETDTSNAYILWALVESGATGLEREIASLKAAASQSKNSYVLALAANVLARSGDQAGAKALRDRLARAQLPTGGVGGATGSIVGSRGESLTIETTGLAVSAWLDDPSYVPQVQRGIQYLAGVCKGGRYGSTQSSVLALRAIVGYDASRAKPKAGGTLRVEVDGKPAGEVAFGADHKGALVLPDISEILDVPGAHTVKLTMVGGSEMPYVIAVDFHRTLPQSAAQPPVKVEVELSAATLGEGQLSDALITVTNTTAEPVPTPVAIIGIPGGAEVRHDQLKEHKKAGRIAAYEVRGRELILYWRSLDAGQSVGVPISLVAELPGTYTGPASRAYLYYSDDVKHWVAGQSMTIAPAK